MDEYPGQLHYLRMYPLSTGSMFPSIRLWFLIEAMFHSRYESPSDGEPPQTTRGEFTVVLGPRVAAGRASIGSEDSESATAALEAR